MGTISSQITSLTIVFWTVYLDTDQRKHQSSASLAFVRGIHRRPVNSPHKWPVTQRMFPFDEVIMFIKMLVILWISHSYLTDVTTAQLWWLLSNINVIWRICRYFYKIKNFPDREINKQSFINPHPVLVQITAPMQPCSLELEIRFTVHQLYNKMPVVWVSVLNFQAMVLDAFWSLTH